MLAHAVIYGCGRAHPSGRNSRTLPHRGRRMTAANSPDRRDIWLAAPCGAQGRGRGGLHQGNRMPIRALGVPLTGEENGAERTGGENGGCRSPGGARRFVALGVFVASFSRSVLSLGARPPDFQLKAGATTND